MGRTIKGTENGRGKKIAVVASRFNEFITQRLLDGCLQELERCHVGEGDITVAWVPGTFEIPVVAKKFAKRKDVHGVICLGAVIRGETTHFELVAHGGAQGIMQVALETEKPVIFGVLAVDTVEQAYKRSDDSGDNKGRDAALAAVEMIDVMKQAAKAL
ncbi:MAG TPA: 6,7-dimethyl-8-ribityllumazine synthase [Candidatus Omnitrophota bacterium]|nr:6,7-dimethyl-8-ribityllumazine synthase [Candidatus Omnitrophota bacterium]